MARLPMPREQLLWQLLSLVASDELFIFNRKLGKKTRKAFGCP